MLQSSLRTMQIQAGVGQAQVSLAIFRLEPEGSFKIRSRLNALAEIVQHEPAIHVPGGHFRIAFQRPSEVAKRLAQLPVTNVQVAGNQCEILVVRKNRLVLFDQGRRVGIPAQVIQVVGQVDNPFTVVGELLQHFITELR